MKEVTQQEFSEAINPACDAELINFELKNGGVLIDVVQEKGGAKLLNVSIKQPAIVNVLSRGTLVGNVVIDGENTKYFLLP